jgi:hypothetical protein
MPKTLSSILALVASALLVLAWGPSSASAKPDATSTAGWITFPLPAGVNPQLTTRHQIQGTRTAHGCRFSDSGTMSPGSSGREQNEIARNPTTCQAIYAEGPIQRSTDSALSDAYGSAAAEGAESAAEGAGIESKEHTEVFFMKTYYEDPIGIDVTSLREDLEWSYFKKGCITEDRLKRTSTWYTTSGWGLDYMKGNPQIACEYAITNSTAKMTNEPFCFPETVWTTYEYNHEIEGKPDGSVRWEWNDEVDSDLGICSNLLSHSHEEDYEEPWEPIE